MELSEKRRFATPVASLRMVGLADTTHDKKDKKTSSSAAPVVGSACPSPSKRERGEASKNLRTSHAIFVKE